MNINFYRKANAQGNLEAWKSCHNRQRRQDRDTALINQALRLNLIIPAGNDNYTVTSKTNKPLSPNSIDKPINTPLTLPPHPNLTPAVRVVQ